MSIGKMLLEKSISVFCKNLLNSNTTNTLRKKLSIVGVILVHISFAFSAFGLNTYLSVFSPNAGKWGKNADQSNSEYGHLLYTQWYCQGSTHHCNRRHTQKKHLIAKKCWRWINQFKFWKKIFQNINPG